MILFVSWGCSSVGCECLAIHKIELIFFAQPSICSSSRGWECQKCVAPMFTLRLHVVTIVTPDRRVWSRYKAKYSHIGHTRLMQLRSQGSPVEGECAHSVWLHWSLESQPKNMTTVTMPQQGGDTRMSTPLVASWNGFRATECQWHCHDELFRWCYQWQSHWQPPHVNWALVRKCLRVPFLMSLGGTGALLG